jgi:hypothetical protein
MKYTNRHGDVYTFTLNKSGDIMWKGKFEHCRYGFPNNYDQAWEKFQERYNAIYISFNTFKAMVHTYDNQNREFVFKELVPLIVSNTEMIDMVDPSGGPYISAGGNLGDFHEEFEGRIVKEFKPMKTGYKIICWNSVDEYVCANKK